MKRNTDLMLIELKKLNDHYLSKLKHDYVQNKNRKSKKTKQDVKNEMRNQITYILYATTITYFGYHFFRGYDHFKQGFKIILNGECLPSMGGVPHSSDILGRLNTIFGGTWFTGMTGKYYTNPVCELFRGGLGGVINAFFASISKNPIEALSTTASTAMFFAFPFAVKRAIDGAVDNLFRCFEDPSYAAKLKAEADEFIREEDAKIGDRTRGFTLFSSDGENDGESKGDGSNERESESESEGEGENEGENEGESKGKNERENEGKNEGENDGDRSSKESSSSSAMSSAKGYKVANSAMSSAKGYASAAFSSVKNAYEEHQKKVNEERDRQNALIAERAAAEEKRAAAEEKRALAEAEKAKKEMKKSEERASKLAERQRKQEERASQKKRKEEEKAAIREAKASEKKRIQEEKAFLRASEKQRKEQERARLAEEKKLAAKSIKKVATSKPSQGRKTRKVNIVSPAVATNRKVRVLSDSMPITKEEFDRNLKKLGVYNKYYETMARLQESLMKRGGGALRGGGFKQSGFKQSGGFAPMTFIFGLQATIMGIFAGGVAYINMDLFQSAWQRYLENKNSYLLQPDYRHTNFVLNLFGLGVSPELEKGLGYAVATTLARGASLMTIWTFAKTFSEKAADTVEDFAPYASSFYVNFD